jgi:hypothetical protein
MVALKRYVVTFLVTVGLIAGSLAVSTAPAEAQWRGRCHRVWRHGHVVRRCDRRSSRSYARAYARRHYRPHYRSYSRHHHRYDYRRDR